MNSKLKCWCAGEILFYGILYYFCFWVQLGSGWRWISIVATGFLFLYPVLSNLIRRKTLSEIGLVVNANQSGWRIIFWVGVSLLILIGMAHFIDLSKGVPVRGNLVAGSWRIPVKGSLLIYLLYPLFALAQQYILMGFLFDRLNVVFGGKKAWSIIFGVGLYTLSHLPNPLLLLASFFGGIFFFVLYAKHKNILQVAILHALLGIFLFEIFIPKQYSFTVGLRFKQVMASRKAVSE